MEIDIRRWSAVQSELRDAGAVLRGHNAQLAAVQETWMAATASRDRAASDRTLHYRDDAIVAQAKAVLAAAEERVISAETELKRVQTLVTAASQRRNREWNVIEKCRAWARQNGVSLPEDGGALPVQGVVQAPSRYARDFLSPGELAAATAPSPALARSASATLPPLSDDAPTNAFGQVFRRIRDVVGGAA